MVGEKDSLQEKSEKKATLKALFLQSLRGCNKKTEPIHPMNNRTIRNY